jgi:hypothetical protein
MPSKQRLPHKYQNIIGDIATATDQSEQSVGMISPGANGTLSDLLAGDEGANHGQNPLAPGLLHKKAPTAVAGIFFWSEPNNRRLCKQD